MDRSNDKNPLYKSELVLISNGLARDLLSAGFSGLVGINWGLELGATPPKTSTN